MASVQGDMNELTLAICRLTDQLNVVLSENSRLKAALQQALSTTLCSRCQLDSPLPDTQASQQASAEDAQTPSSGTVPPHLSVPDALCTRIDSPLPPHASSASPLSTTETTRRQPLPDCIPGPGDDVMHAKTAVVFHGGEGDVERKSGSFRTHPSSHGGSENRRRKQGKGKKGKQQEGDDVDWSPYPCRHVALKVMYLGERYHGFASQAGSEPTVEGALFAALRRTRLLTTSPAESHYSRCGRTDKGVNAHCQVIALFLRSRLHPSLPPTHPPTSQDEEEEGSDVHITAGKEEKRGGGGGGGGGGVLTGVGGDGGGGGFRSGGCVDRVAMARASRSMEASCCSAAEESLLVGEIDYVGALNRALPPHIRVLSWCPVPTGFSARFSCLWREYLYFFTPQNLDIELMRDAARRFEGEHDFRNVAKMDATNVSNFRRRIERFTVEPVPSNVGVWAFRVRGSAFLWHQVRCMAAMLLAVGRKEEPPTVVSDLLDLATFPAKPQYAMAAEHPLVLHTCAFQGLRFRSPPGSAWMVRRHLEGLRDASVVKLAVIQTALDSMGTPATYEERIRNGIRKKDPIVPKSTVVAVESGR